MTDPTPRVGLVLAGEAREQLQRILCQSGYEVQVGESPGNVLSMANSGRFDAWLICVKEEELLGPLLGTGKFILPAENPPPVQEGPAFDAWAMGLVARLDAALWDRPGSQAPAVSGWDQVKSVWLIAGSTGATPALQQFLNALERPPPVAFLFAQHYDPHQQHQLQDLTLENTAFTLHLANGHHGLRRGRVLVVPPRGKISIERFGAVASSRRPWEPGLSPNLSEVLVTFAAADLPRPGVVMLSGMGSDGVAALEVLAASGFRIWAQSPESAVCASMPRAALETGLVDRVGSPRQLGRALSALYPDCCV